MTDSDSLLTALHNVYERGINIAIARRREVRSGLHQPSTAISPFDSVSPLPPNFVERPELQNRLRDLILGQTGKSALTTVQGIGGIGKTELVRAMCHTSEVRDTFCDGIVWIEIGRESRRTLLEYMKEVAYALNTDPGVYTVGNCKAHYRSLLATKAVLIVLDDVWSRADVEPFISGASRCKVLFTTRDASLAHVLGAEKFNAERLTDAQSRELVALCSRRECAQLPEVIEEIVRECSYLPLGLRLIGSILRGRCDAAWPNTLEKLQRASIPAPHAPSKVSVDALGAHDQMLHSRYLQLGVFLKQTAVHVSILQDVWGVDAATARRTVEVLQERSLLYRDRDSIRLHDLLLDYIRSLYPDQEALRLYHQKLRLSSRVVARTRSRPQRHSLLALTPSQSPIRTVEGHSEPVSLVVISADGRRAISASINKTLKFWDVENLRVLWTREGCTHSISDVVLSADGRRALSTSWGPKMEVWDVEGGRVLRALEGHAGWVNSMAISADGRRAVSASEDQTLKVWDLERGCELLTLKGHTKSVHGVVVRADGRRAVSASDDQTLKVWDLESGGELSTLVCPSFPRYMAVSVDEKLAISVSLDKALKVWDADSGHELRTLQGHTDSITRAAVSSDGRRAVSVSLDKTLRVWDVKSGICMATFTFDARVSCCAISENTIAAGDEAGFLHFLTIGRLIPRAVSSFVLKSV